MRLNPLFSTWHFPFDTFCLFSNFTGRNVFRTLFKNKLPERNELFLPKRMAYVVDLEDEFDTDIPTTLIRSKADCPSVEVCILLIVFLSSSIHVGLKLGTVDWTAIAAQDGSTMNYIWFPKCWPNTPFSLSRSDIDPASIKHFSSQLDI